MSEGLARAYGKRGRTSGLQTPQQHRACAWSHEEPRVRPHGPARAAQGPRRLSAPRHHPQYHMGNQPPRSAARLKQCNPYAAQCSTEPAPPKTTAHRLIASIETQKTYRPDEAIQSFFAVMDCFAGLAMTISAT